MENLLNINNIEQLNQLLAKDGVVMVDFWAPWCGPCKVLGPVIEKLAEDYKERAEVYKVNVDDVPDVSEKYNIRSVPTVILFKNGYEEKRLVGMKIRALYEQALKDLL